MTNIEVTLQSGKRRSINIDKIREVTEGDNQTTIRGDCCNVTINEPYDAVMAKIDFAEVKREQVKFSVAFNNVSGLVKDLKDVISLSQINTDIDAKPLPGKAPKKKYAKPEVSEFKKVDKVKKPKQ
jgi:hypothetical protein